MTSFAVASFGLSSNLSFATSASNPSIYTNYINVHLSIDKLDDTNYAIWASDVKLWLKSQGYVNQITQKVIATNFAKDTHWLKIDA